MDYIIHKLMDYRRLKAEIKSIQLDVEELHDEISVASISYDEKSAPTNKFNSVVENQAVRIADKTTELEILKRQKEREIERIENALSVLNDKEKEVLELKYIRGYRWDTVTYKMDRTYSQCKRIEEDALVKIKDFFR